MPRGPRRNLRPVARKHVAADGLDVDRHLADRLAGVEQVGDAGRARDLADRLGRVDEPAVGRHVGDGDQLDPLVDQRRAAPRPRAGRCSSLGMTSTGAPVRRATWRKAMTLLAYSARRGQDAVARPEGERVEGHVPGAGRVLDDGDLVAAAAEQRRGRVVGALDRRAGGPPPRSRRCAPRSWRWPMTASSTGWGISAAPALLKWTTCAQPGVSRRARSMSIGHGDGSLPRGPSGGPFVSPPGTLEGRWRQRCPARCGKNGKNRALDGRAAPLVACPRAGPGATAPRRPAGPRSAPCDSRWS